MKRSSQTAGFKRHGAKVLWSALLTGAVNVAPAQAWWPQGHSILTSAAVQSLPADFPAFFREGAGQIAHSAQDPDVDKNRDMPTVTDAEAPEHFIDYELLGGEALPATRYQFLQLCERLKIKPNEVGLLPYAITEDTERLAIALAEHRRWPNNRYIQMKCLVIAGRLAHYAGDLCMPLHTTVHHNGRVQADGKSPRSGIHARVDSLIEALQMKPEALVVRDKLQAAPDIMPMVLQTLAQSRALVDRTYQLETTLPPSEESATTNWKPTPELTSFANERAQSAVRFTANLFLTAWQKSAAVKLPAWLKREDTTP